MRWHHRLYVALRGLFGSSALDRELNEELQYHFDREVQRNLERGMTQAHARRAASIAIGNLEPIRETSRDGRTGAWLRLFGRDLAFGMRLLKKAPGFSVAAIAIVALGVGAVTAIFSVVYGVALKPLPYREPERLVNIWTLSPQRYGDRHFPVNAADHRDWLAGNHVFEDIALLRDLANFNLIGEGEPERLLAARISANLLPVLGVSPIIGRGFTEEEDEIGNERVAILGHGLWRRRFGADPSVVGRSINLSGVPHQVVGVMGPDFQYPGRQFQLWVPLTINPAAIARKSLGNNFHAVARLKPGVTVAEAQSEMATIAARLAPLNQVTTLTGIDVVPMHADLLTDVRTALYVMLAAVLCLLLVAALNLSSLLAARTASRSGELSVRLALGATRARVAMQSIAEIVPLLVLGGILGVVAAAAAVQWFMPLAPSTLPRLEDIEVNGVVLWTATAVLMITGIVGAWLPAAYAGRADLTTASREGMRTSAGGAKQTRVRNMLVMSQIALALPLLTGSVLLARTFTTLTSIDPGFTPEGALTMHVAIPRSKYRNDSQVAQVMTRFMERVSAMPGVSSVGAVNVLPLAGGGSVGFLEFDTPGRTLDELPAADFRTATPDYFKAMGIRLMAGRFFDDRDEESAPTVGIIDAEMARQIWPAESAIGKRFRPPAALNNNVQLPWIEIVGVVARVKHDGLDAESRGQAYWNYRQRPMDRMVLVVRAERNVAALGASVIAGIHEIDPEQPVYDVRTLDEWVERSLSQRWMNMALVGAFAASALALCAIGVYGVIAFGVARQRREFGIRLALGASRRGIAAAVVRHGLVLASIGIGAGLVLAVALTRSMSSLLFGVSASDVLSFASATLAILTVALLASYLPARRAAAVDPALTLRAD
jgi:putative ABC transport system permease protein